MKKRMTDVDIWKKEWFMDLSPKLKCLIRYLFDNCDPAGVWSPNWRLASLQIGEPVSFSDLELLPPEQFEILPTGKIFLPDFIPFQCGTLSQTCPAHKPVFESILKNNLSNRVLNRVFDTQQDKDKDKDKEIKEGGAGGNHKDWTDNDKLTVFPIKHCAEIAMNDERWKKINNPTPDEIKNFNLHLEGQGVTTKNLLDWKKHFYNWKKKKPPEKKQEQPAPYYEVDEAAIAARKKAAQELSKQKTKT